MTRIELTVAVAAILLMVFALGWASHWLWGRITGVTSPRSDRADELAAELLMVEETLTRERAEAAERERAFRTEAEARQTHLESLLREREAELYAAMDGLRAARAAATGD